MVFHGVATRWETQRRRSRVHSGAARHGEKSGCRGTWEGLQPCRCSAGSRRADTRRWSSTRRTAWRGVLCELLRQGTSHRRVKMTSRRHTTQPGCREEHAPQHSNGSVTAPLIIGAAPALVRHHSARHAPSPTRLVVKRCTVTTADGQTSRPWQGSTTAASQRTAASHSSVAGDRSTRRQTPSSATARCPGEAGTPKNPTT